MANQINVDLQVVINDLLDQVRRLTADNAVLRAAVSHLQSDRLSTPPSVAESETEDMPEESIV